MLDHIRILITIAFLVILVWDDLDAPIDNMLVQPDLAKVGIWTYHLGLTTMLSFIS